MYINVIMKYLYNARIIKKKTLSNFLYTTVYNLLSGLGWAMVTISGLVCIYYNIIITYIVYFFFASFGTQVPWATCDNKWNTAACTTSFKNEDAGNSSWVAGDYIEILYN